MSGKLIEKIRGVQPLSLKSEQKLLSRLTAARYKKNDLLLNAGQLCKKVYYVENGFVRSLTYVDGKEINLNFTLADNFVTNLRSLRNGTPSAHIIKVCEPSVIWSFSKDDLQELYKESEEFVNFGRNLLELLLIEQEEQANLFKISNPTGRYESILRNSPQILQNVTLTQLSSFIGVSRETLSRIRKKKINPFVTFDA